MNQPVTAPVTAPSNAEAWGFVLQRSRQIERLAGKFFGKLRDEDKEDARSEYIARIVAQYPNLRTESAKNPEAVIVTWLGWQARAVQTQFCRTFRKRTREGTSDEKVLVTLHCQQGEGCHENIERTLEQHGAEEAVEALFGLATPKQREAMLTILLDMDSKDMRARFKLANNARNERLYDLRDRALRAGMAC